MKDKKATSLLVVGFENSGKSTLSATIKNALVINCDHKTYNFDQIHSNYTKWEGIDDFKAFINAKILTYKEKMGVLPENVVIDTITHLYNTMIKYNSEKHSSNGKTNGFKAMEQNNADIIDISIYFRQLNAKGINVIIMAHTKVDQNTDRFTVPAQGSFRDSGSWQSFVSESIFIDRKKDTHNVVLKDPSNACVRSNLKEIVGNEDNVISVKFKDFDINAHINKIVESISENKDKEL